MKNKENKRITKTVTFRVDEKTVDLIEGLYQTKKYKSKGEIVDVAISDLIQNKKDYDIIIKNIELVSEGLVKLDKLLGILSDIKSKS